MLRRARSKFGSEVWSRRLRRSHGPLTELPFDDSSEHGFTIRPVGEIVAAL
jgi:hypothetical protein